MTYTAINFVPAYLGKLVNQTVGGIYVGMVLQLAGSSWTPALADDTSDAESVGIVSQIIDSSNFVITQTGWIYGITSPTFTPGTLYYLSGSMPGLLSSTPGAVVLPLLYADTTSSGYFMNSYPVAASQNNFTWNLVTTDTAMLPNNGYFCNQSDDSVLNMTLPSSFVLGDKIIVTNIYIGGFIIKQLDVPSQQIFFGDDITTIGSGGSIASQKPRGDSITLVATTSGTEMFVTDSVGNFTIV